MTAEAPRTVYILCDPHRGGCGREIPALETPIIDVQCPRCSKLWQWRAEIKAQVRSCRV